MYKYNFEVQGHWRLRFLLVNAILFLTIQSGCTHYSARVEKGQQLDTASIKQIIIDKSTQSDVFKLLGTPHSIIRGKGTIEEAQTLSLGQLGLVPSFGDFYSYKDSRQVSVDDRHYAMLYRFAKSTGSAAGVHLIVIGFRNADFQFKSDELLLVLDTETNVVTDVAYRKEVSP